MLYAVPTDGGRLCSHFGHCRIFTFIETDEHSGEIVRTYDMTPPPHEPGVLPRWLHDQGADVIIAGGMGSRAQSLFEAGGVSVVVGAAELRPEELVRSHAAGKLRTSANACDH